MRSEVKRSRRGIVPSKGVAMFGGEVVWVDGDVIRADGAADLGGGWCGEEDREYGDGGVGGII